MSWYKAIGYRIPLVLLFLLVWEAIGRVAGSIIFPPPTEVFGAYPRLISSGVLSDALLVSMKAFFVGYGLAVVVGIALGLLLGRFELMNYLAEPFVSALYSTPRVALVPLILIWFGVGFTGRVFIIFMGGVFPILINTAAGVRRVDTSLTEVGRSLCANEFQMARDIVFPAALPYVMSGLRIGFGRSLVGVVVAEFFLEIVGLGGLIVTYGDSFSTEKMLAVVFVISLIGILLTQLLQLIEKRATHWSRTA